ncbi:uncharacterized protein LOC131936183 [Physella acuta]|uniref:uncharacterized protein LOC131936183 n=1 Tax=Physella acuta TaxID=109671 RepID=UPI0027DD232B|nr:uncharacterized protein LOC131936183 [Physella acuta]
MQQTVNQLRAPELAPCPNMNDMTPRGGACAGVRQQNPSGAKNCQYWTSTPGWEQDTIPMDSVNLEDLNYNQYRYQVYAKPTDYQCHTHLSTKAPERVYVPPNTDIRALRQTTYIPLLPTKPGGEREVTFPMTPQTLGQPDVTTACCVPVIPCNPGFMNLTPHVLPDPRCYCDSHLKCKPPPQLVPRRIDIVAEMETLKTPRTSPFCGYNALPPAQQFMMPPSNHPGNACSGFYATFPPPNQLYGQQGMQSSGPPVMQSYNQQAMQSYNQQVMQSYNPQAMQLTPMHPDPNTASMSTCANVSSNTQLNEPSQQAVGSGPGQTEPGQCFNGGNEYVSNINDGLNPRGGPDSKCLVPETFRFADRVQRLTESKMETQEQRDIRLRTMYGSYGSYLLARVTPRRNLLGPPNNIFLQGNGFQWSHPQNVNQMCYVLSRNTRC